MAHTVSTLLAAARAAHTRYRAAAGRIDKQGKLAAPPQPLTCGQAVQQALSLRAEAHALDPDMADPAWGEDLAAMRASSEQLMAFYVRVLAPDVREVCSV